MIARNSSYDETKDDFPTPPWATRALLKYYPGDISGIAWEPAAGRGYMAKTLGETVPTFRSDIVDYGDPEGHVRDFLADEEFDDRVADWVITNPPYKYAAAFYKTARRRARQGVALLVRINWLQNGKRHLQIFEPDPPQILFFAGRISCAYGKVVQKSSAYFQHVWLVWDNSRSAGSPIWIPEAAQAQLERPEDYV